MARTGLRMMPTFPSPPLKSRTAGFPQYVKKSSSLPNSFFAARGCARFLVLQGATEDEYEASHRVFASVRNDVDRTAGGEERRMAHVRRRSGEHALFPARPNQRREFQ